ncbi:MAG: PhzF family phenazine biosynthesis protein [Anaerovoracaceae bacterium]
MKFFIVDAFTDEVFGGNPAGVVIIDEGTDFPSNEIMIKTAAELRYSETAFVKRLSDYSFHTRYFTPTEEVDLCGHATIAVFSVLEKEGYLFSANNNTPITVINRTLAGDLEIKIDNGFVMMDMATPEHKFTIDKMEDLVTLYKVMGLDKYVDADSVDTITALQCCSQRVKLLPMAISTGLPDIIMPVKNREMLNDINPDYEALAKLSNDYGVIGVHAFAIDLGTPGITAHCRNFGPAVGIDEEPATGTANGALTYYLYAHELISNDAESCYLQGESMERPSKVYTHIKKSPDGLKIKVGGSAAILAKGEIDI